MVRVNLDKGFMITIKEVIVLILLLLSLGGGFVAGNYRATKSLTGAHQAQLGNIIDTFIKAGYLKAEENEGVPSFKVLSKDEVCGIE